MIVGDVFDRGDKVTETLWALFKLEKQAKAAGGKVHLLLGNHEFMILHGDIRYINPKYRFTTGSFGIEYPKLYDQHTVMGRWLRSKNISTVINGIGFVHGGYSQELLNKESSLKVLNNTFKEQNKKISLDYINLENVYKKKDDFTIDEISKYIDENKENLKEKNISFNYSKVTPATLIGIDEYNDLFFQKIDNIENDISNGFTYDDLLRKNNLKSVLQTNFKLNDKNISEVINKDVLKKIFNKAEENKIELLEENDFFVLYEIKKVEKILPSTESTNFISNVKEIMFNKSKNDFNYDLIKKISVKSFTQKNFEDISESSNIGAKNILISSITDTEKFTTDSIKYIYTLQKNNFGIIGDKNKNIYLIKILNISESNISKSSENYKKYTNLTNVKIRDSMYESYDFHLNNKYKVKINEKTFERVKNYFQ